MTKTKLGAFLLLCLVCSVQSQQKKLDFAHINRTMAKLCLGNRKNYINNTNVVKCNILYDVSCWKETLAGQTVIQPCPFLLFDAKDKISRRCDEKGRWQKMNITNCRRLTPKEAVERGKQAANIPATDESDTLTHSERLQRLYVAMSWIAFFVLLPTFILICIVISRENERFTLHRNLILAFILRHITLFIFYYENMGERDASTGVCNAFWLLNRYFAASEIAWMLNEGVFLLRMLVYPFDSESYMWFYFLYGWGFSGVLTFCLYLPYMQFKIARVSAGCWAWVEYSHSSHMLVLYIPLTIMLVINFGIAVYVIQMLVKKLKNSCSSQMNRIKKTAKAVVVLISIFGLIYLLTFYLPSGNNPSYEYFIAVVYPLQGVMVCIFCIFLSAEFREALKKHWMKWRYGILIQDTNPYSTDRDQEAGPSGEHGTSASVLTTASSEDTPPRPLSAASLRDKSSAQLPRDPHRRTTQMSLLSRSSDLTKYRLAKVEPEPMVPLRVQSAGPRDWVPPTLQAVRAWGNVESSKNPDESNVSEARVNEGFSGSQFSLSGSKASTGTTKQELTESLAELEPETKDPEESEKQNNSTPDDTREDSPQQSEDQFSLFSSQLFENDAEASNESPSSTPVPSTELTPSDEPLTEATADACASQDAAEPSTSAEDSNASARGKRFWDKAKQLASQSRRSRLEHNRVLATEGDSLQFRPTHTDRFKEADEYRLAWIANIIRGTKSRENESDA